MIRWVLAASLGFTLTTPASAALIDNGASTTDTLTGLTWLDLSATQVAGAPMALPDLQTQLGAGGLFDGYRIATWPEVHAFMTNAGVQNSTTTGPTSFTAADVAAGAAWSALIDETLVASYGSNIFGSRGYVLVDDPTLVPNYPIYPHPTNMLLVGYYLEIPGGPTAGWGQWTNDFWLGRGFCDCIIPGAGWWLVSESAAAVPEPATSAILAIGLAAFGFVRCRTRKRSQRAA